MSDERIQISIDDLDDDEGSPAARPLAASSTPAPAPGASRSLPPITPGPAPVTIDAATGGNAGHRSVVGQLGANPVISGLTVGVIAGVVGALTGWWVNHSIIDTPLIENGVLAVVVSPLVGLLLASWPDLTAGAYASAAKRGAVGAAVGLVAALAALAVAQPIFESVRTASSESLTTDVARLKLALWVGWVILGTLVGFGLGLSGGIRKMVNGAIGGLIGGAIGGLIYVQLADEEALRIVDNEAGFSTSLGPQVLAIVATSVSVCLAIGIVERVARQAWLRVTQGPLGGKEYILYRESTTIGASSSCDIVLAKDAAVAGHHARIERRNERAQLVAETSQVTTVNGAPVRTAVLRPGDIVGVGSFGLTYEER